MLLLNLAVLAFLFGFVLGKFSPHRWGARKPEPTITLAFPEPSSEAATRWERAFAEQYKTAKARGLIR